MVKKLHILPLVLLLICIGCTRQEVVDITQDNALTLEVYPQLGHNGAILSVAISSDGKRIVSGSIDNTIKLWDTETGREIRTFSGHIDQVNSVAFSHNGKYILSGSGYKDYSNKIDNSLRLWNVETGQEIRTFQGHTDSVNSVAFSPDRKHILSASNDDTLMLWDMETGQEIKTFYAGGNVDSAVFSPDGNQILSSSHFSYRISNNTSESDTTEGKTAEEIWERYFNNHKFYRLLTLWDVETGERIKYFLWDNFPTFTAFSPDGKSIICGSDDNSLSMFNPETEQEIIFSKPDVKRNGITSVAFSPDGKYVISGSMDETIKLWDAETGDIIRIFSGNTGGVNSVAFSPDGKHIISGSQDETIKLWDIETGQVVQTYIGYAGGSRAIVFHPNEKKILSGSRDHTIRLWDIETGREIKNYFGLKDVIASVAFSPDGTQILSGSNDGIICFLNTATGAGFAVTDMHVPHVDSVAFSSDGKYTLSESFEVVNIIELETLEIKSFKPEDRMMFRTAAFSPDGKSFLTGDFNDTLWLWDIETGLKTKSFKGQRFVNSVTFSSDGKYILSGADDATIKLWDVETGQNEKNFPGHTASVNSVMFSPDDKNFISGSDDGTVKLWDIITGGEIKTFYGHTSMVKSVAFSPDGKQILSGSDDGTTRLWDIKTGLEIASFISFADGEWITITPDGYYNASAKGDLHLNARIGNQVFGIDQFAAAFYQPEVVQARLQGKKDPPIVKLQGDIRHTNEPPRVDIIINNHDTFRYIAELTVTISDQFTPIRKTSIEIFVNGRLVGENELKVAITSNEISMGNTRLLASSKNHQLEFTIPVKLDPGFNYIEVIAENDSSYGFKQIILNSPETETVQKGDLYVLAIGVNKYTKNKGQSGYPNLEHSASDAEKIINSFINQGGTGKRYNNVHTLCLSDNEPEKPTKRAILKSMEFLESARSHDTVVFLISGHGKTENGAYYFMPSDTVFDGKRGFKPRSAVNVEELVKALDIPGRKIVLLDTCESGGVDVNRLVRTLKNRSMVVFTASRDGEYAYENGRYGGYFTHSIVEGVSGKAAGSDNNVLITTLGGYITERVWDLNEETGTSLQHPMKYIPDGYHNFVISMAAD
jgi:WD40 repeat protein